MIDDVDWKVKHDTLRESTQLMKERIQNFKTNFGLKEQSDGSITIDYDKFTEALGLRGSLELRSIIDQKYNISGEAGEKPRVKLTA